jgi:hypothetical protein
MATGNFAVLTSTTQRAGLLNECESTAGWWVVVEYAQRVLAGMKAALADFYAASMLVALPYFVLEASTLQIGIEAFE